MTLDALLKTLRANNVKAYEGRSEGPGFDVLSARIEFWPSPEAAATMQDAKSGDEPDRCKCGHAEYAHVNGLCTMGCDAEKCAPEEADA